MLANRYGCNNWVNKFAALISTLKKIEKTRGTEREGNQGEGTRHP